MTEQTPAATPAITPDRYADIAHAIEEQLARVIVGQTDLIRTVVVCLLAEGHALLEGVPGLGKTQLLKALSDAIDVDFSRIQFTPDLMPADISGTQILEPTADGGREFRFREGPVFANLVLADEINRATPKTQSALLEAMQERMVTVAGATRPLPRPFLVMATQNPLDSEGTYPLPDAQLDRFLVKAVVPFPSAEDLDEILTRTTGGAMPQAQAVANTDTLRSMIALTREVPVPAHVQRHAVDLVVATHPGEQAPETVKRLVRFGASPRGAQGMILGGKVLALMDGRPNVSVDDIRAMAPAVLRHRVVLGYEAVAEGTDGDAVVADVLAHVPPPSAGLRGAP